MRSSPAAFLPAQRNLNCSHPPKPTTTVRNITGSSGVPVGQQFAVLVHSVDAVLTGCVPTGEKKLELQPPAEADDHGVRNITGSSGGPVGQERAGFVYGKDVVLTGCRTTDE